jgi:hypothetical protein
VAVKRALLLPAAAAACMFVIVFVLLPRPSAADRLALKVIASLQRTRIRGSVIHVDGARVVARCTLAHGRRELISLPGGTLLIVRRTRVRPLTVGGRLLATAARSPLLAAEADLSGPRPLYVLELIGREEARRAIVRPLGPRAQRYLVRLSNVGPRVDLIVSGKTFRPLSIRYGSRSFNATATLITGRHGC